MKKSLVIRVGTLATFCIEVPAPAVLRLSLTECWNDSKVGTFVIPRKQITLTLFGINTEGQVVTLSENHTVHWGTDEPAFPLEQSIYAAMPKLRELVGHLVAA